MTSISQRFETSSVRALLLLCALAAQPTSAAPKKPKAAQKAPAAVPRPAAPPVEDKLEVPRRPEPAPPVAPPNVVQSAPNEPVSPELAPPPHPLGLFVGAEVGALAPLSVLTVGVRAAGRAEYRLVRDLPLLATLAIGFERHTANAARQFSPPAGGYEPFALETQIVLAIELGAVVEVWSNDRNALIAGLSYGLLSSWSKIAALGSTTAEFGMGHQVAIDAGYTRRFGSFSLFVRGRWAVRRTASGERTSTVESPWYQSLGLVVGAGVTL